MSLPLPEDVIYSPYASWPPTQNAIARLGAMFGGWQCPSCLHCFSPSVTECPHCPPRQQLGTPEPGTGTAQPPHRLTAAASCPCQPSAEGGLCGCEEDGDAPAGPCTSFNCTC